MGNSEQQIAIDKLDKEGVCKAALNALNQTLEQFSRRLENFEKNI